MMRHGKTAVTAAMCEYALMTGRSLAIGTSDQAATIERLSHHLPKGTLFEVVGDHFVVPVVLGKGRGGANLWSLGGLNRSGLMFTKFFPSP